MFDPHVSSSVPQSTKVKAEKFTGMSSFDLSVSRIDVIELRR